MRIITLSLHGCKAGTDAHSGKIRPSGIRDAIGGWSGGSTRRNVDFLRSVEYSQLTGMGVCFTGTLKHCPPTSDHWHRIRKAYFDRLRRMGVIRIHWVTEWQRRGVPHLHGMFFFPVTMCSMNVRMTLIKHWIELTTAYGALPVSQHAIMMHDALGWAQYSAKHASRGVGHYQRSPENVPTEWQHKTGRVWGKTGEWPTRDPMKFHVADDVYYRFRRMARSWRISDARVSKSRYRIKAARRCLVANTRTLSDVRGVSEWLPLDTATALLFWASTLSDRDNAVCQV
ncbi:MAG: RepXfC [Inoviridae sp.]|nr:MAG: RepXfC [Inoviridae sp.]